MPVPEEMDVDALAERLRRRTPSKVLRLPGPTRPPSPSADALGLREEMQKLREVVQGYREQEAERRGAWSVMRTWIERAAWGAVGATALKLFESLTS